MNEASLGSFLVAENVADARAIASAQEHQLMMGGRLDTALLDMGVVRESRLLRALGEFYHTKTVAGASLLGAGDDVIRLISPRVATRFGVVPFRIEGKKLAIASLNPGDILIEDELNLLTDCMVSTYVCLEIRLYEALARFYAVHLPTRVTSLIRRFAAGASAEAQESAGIAEKKRKRDAETEYTTVAVRPETPERSAVNPELEETQPVLKTKQDRPVVLELSDEELAEFPSMREGQDILAAPTQPPTSLVETPKELPEEVSDQDQSDVAEQSIDDRMMTASVGLQNAEMRDEIADALLHFCEPYLRRRMLLIVRKDQIIGWRGEGEGVEEAAIRAISIPQEEPSIFSGISQGQAFWLGPLPSMPRNLDLLLGLGGEEPRDCVVLPVSLRSKVVCFLYGDNGGDGVGGVPVAELRRLMAKASLAFQVYILKSKIRRL
ncbi:MAG: hypothetical protein GY906_15900 [bacterium]|nr:hypothetical protein [bacterium]